MKRRAFVQTLATTSAAGALGTDAQGGTPSPSLERQGSGYLIEVGGGHRAVDVTHAFFTHLHYDHCMDYGRLARTSSGK